MEPWHIMFAIMFGWCGFLVWSHKTKPRIEKRWKAMGEEFGLSATGLNLSGDAGEQHSLDVKVLDRSHDEANHPTTVATVTGPCIPWDVSLEPHGFFAVPGFVDRLVGKDIQLGDKAFDDKFRIGGDEAQVLALLTHDVRQAFMKTGPSSIYHLANGEITVRVPQVVFKTGLRLILKSAVELAEACEQGEQSVPARLAQNARFDPVAEVRRRNLELLLSAFPDNTLATDVAEQSLESSDLDVHLPAAAYLHDYEALGLVATGEHAATRRGRAIDALALAPADDPTVRQYLGRLEPSGEGAVDAPLARALTIHALPDRQERLVSILSTGDTTGQLAAIEALAAVGDLEAVAPLRAVANKLLGGKPKGAASDAIAAIQARAKGTRGGLTVAEGIERIGAMSDVEA